MSERRRARGRRPAGRAPQRRRRSSTASRSRCGAGEILGLVGESGSGKTTTALALLGYARRGSAHRRRTDRASPGRTHRRRGTSARLRRLRGRPRLVRAAGPGQRAQPRAAHRRGDRRRCSTSTPAPAPRTRRSSARSRACSSRRTASSCVASRTSSRAASSSGSRSRVALACEPPARRAGRADHRPRRRHPGAHPRRDRAACGTSAAWRWSTSRTTSPSSRTVADRDRGDVRGPHRRGGPDERRARARRATRTRAGSSRRSPTTLRPRRLREHARRRRRGRRAARRLRVRAALPAARRRGAPTQPSPRSRRSGRCARCAASSGAPRRPLEPRAASSACARARPRRVPSCASRSSRAEHRTRTGARGRRGRRLASPSAAATASRSSASPAAARRRSRAASSGCTRPRRAASCSTARPLAGRAASRTPRAAPPHPDRLPEPVRLAQPAPPRSRDAIARPARVLRGLGAAGGRAEVAALLERVRLPARLAEPLPGRALGRRAPARRDRARARRAPRAPRLRRDHLRARRLGAGRRARAARRAAARARARAALHLARPRRRRERSPTRVLVLERGVVCEEGPVAQPCCGAPAAPVHAPPARCRATPTAARGAGDRMTICPIATVEAIALRAPTVDPEDVDGSSETVVVRLVDEEGREGIGEADAPAVVVRELVRMGDVHAWSRGLATVLVGRDPVLAVRTLRRPVRRDDLPRPARSRHPRALRRRRRAARPRRQAARPARVPPARWCEARGDHAVRDGLSRGGQRAARSAS